MLDLAALSAIICNQTDSQANASESYLTCVWVNWHFRCHVNVLAGICCQASCHLSMAIHLHWLSTCSGVSCQGNTSADFTNKYQRQNARTEADIGAEHAHTLGVLKKHLAAHLQRQPHLLLFQPQQRWQSQAGKRRLLLLQSPLQLR